MVKIVEAIKQANESGRRYIGFEFFAPTTEAGTVTLYDRIERMSLLDPLFCSITWGDYGKTAETSIEVAATCQLLLTVNYQVNITGYTSTPEEVHKWLSVLKAKGVRNLLVTRGRPVGAAHDGTVHFPHAVDLVRFIRQNFSDYFGIAVVAFPEKEEESLDDETEMRHLKAKIDAGADYVITHNVFDAAVYADFCSRCRDHGVRCPILPGIMPACSLRQLDAFGLRRLSGVPELRRRMEAVKDDDDETRRVVTAFHQELVQKLFSLGAGGVYFFTMNSETLVTSIVKGLNLTTHRAFPWKPSENEERRRKENVRPIHWCLRVASYMARTAQWKDFQNGERWTAAPPSNPQLLNDISGYHARLLLRSRAKRCAQFLSLNGITEVPKALAEISRIFINFLDGNGSLPWAEELSGETEYVNEVQLKPLNARGLFTVNSQPQVNGMPSSNKVIGWGPRDGFIYQKGYLEFFSSLPMAQTVFTTLEKYPSLQYMAMNRHGKMVKAHWRVEEAAASPLSPSVQQTDVSAFGAGVTAVTWGVFPGREIIQPTIVSVDSLRAWVGEAFGLWAAPFPSNDVPPVIQLIQSEWVLVSVVDNTFQESPSPLERAVLEVCSKLPPLVSVGAGTQRSIATPIVHHSSPLTSSQAVEAAMSSRYREQGFNAGDMVDFLKQQKVLLSNGGS